MSNDETQRSFCETVPAKGHDDPGAFTRDVSWIRLAASPVSSRRTDGMISGEQVNGEPQGESWLCVLHGS